MGLDEQGNPGYYSFMNPNFTVFHQEDHTFSDLWSDFSGDFHAFYRNVTEDMERYGDCRGIKPKSGQPRNFFCISCVPWCSYSAYSTFQYGAPPISSPSSPSEDTGSAAAGLHARHFDHRPCGGGRIPYVPLL